MPEYTRAALAAAWDSGYEHASKLATSRRGIHADDCRCTDYTFSECGDPRVREWTEEHPGFWVVYEEWRAGFRAYLEGRGGVFATLAALVKPADSTWLALEPQPES